MTTYAQLYPLFIALLDDPDGINEEAFNLMRPMLDSSLADAVECNDGRYYIGEDYAEQLRQQMALGMSASEIEALRR